MTNVTSPERTLVLVRHGESTWNELSLMQGQDDRSTLTERGREQAACVATELSEQSFDLIVSSDLQRAFETASIIGEASGLEVVTEPLLRERNYGAAEGTSLDDVTDVEVGIEGGIVTNEDIVTVGGETLRQLRERAGQFMALRASRWPAKRLLVVTHGGTIRALQSYCAGTPFLGALWQRVGNCSVWTVVDPHA